MQSLLQHKLILVLSGLALAGLIWYGLSPSPPEGDLVSSPATEDAQVDQGIVPTLLTLRAVKLDGTIFSAGAFTRLKDFSTEIVEEPVGRSNPFAPLSARTSTQTTFTPANR
ncbi:MAG: hypothetical protein Q7R90_01430 [bacterium]|nr:hypothetical protein [bacterium]